MSEPRNGTGYPRDPNAADRAPGGYGGDTAEAVLDMEEEEGQEGAFGDTTHQRTVTPEAKQGVTTGSPSGGVAGGTPAEQVRDRAGE
jgi:hypothetical protein